MILLISGTINVGKTVSAQALRKIWPKTEVVEPDKYFDLFPGMELGKAGKKCLKMATDRAAILSKAGKNVIIPYPLAEGDYKRVMKAFKQLPVDVHYVTLVARPDLLIGKRNKRKNPKWEEDVINWHEELGVTKPRLGIVIDTSDLSIDETADKIIEQVESNKSLVKSKELKVRV